MLLASSFFCVVAQSLRIKQLWTFPTSFLESFFFNSKNVVKEKEVAIILKFSVAKFKSKIRRCSNLTFRSLKVSFTFSIFRPFPSSRNSSYQNETKCKSFLVKMSFICMRIKNHFRIISFAVSLALKLRLEQLRNDLLAWRCYLHQF